MRLIYFLNCLISMWKTWLDNRQAGKRKKTWKMVIIHTLDIYLHKEWNVTIIEYKYTYIWTKSMCIKVPVLPLMLKANKRKCVCVNCRVFWSSTDVYHTSCMSELKWQTTDNSFFILNVPQLRCRHPAFCSTSVSVQPRQWILADATDFMDHALKPYFSAMAFA